MNHRRRTGGNLSRLSRDWSRHGVGGRVGGGCGANGVDRRLALSAKNTRKASILSMLMEQGRNTSAVGRMYLLHLKYVSSKDEERMYHRTTAIRRKTCNSRCC
jgi:hypothetical protein